MFFATEPEKGLCKEKMLGKMSTEKGYSKCNKRAAKYGGPCYVQLNGVCLDNKPMQAGGSGDNLGEATREAIYNYNYGCYNRGFGPGAYYVSREENC